MMGRVCSRGRKVEGWRKAGVTARCSTDLAVVAVMTFGLGGTSGKKASTTPHATSLLPLRIPSR